MREETVRVRALLNGAAYDYGAGQGPKSRGFYGPGPVGFYGARGTVIYGWGMRAPNPSGTTGRA